MTTFQSPVKTVNFSAEKIFNYLINFSNYDKLLPLDKIKDFNADVNKLSFSVNPLGRFLLTITEKNEFSTIKFRGDAKVNFTLLVELTPFTEEVTKLKVTIDAELNAFEKMVAAKPIQSLVDNIADNATKVDIS